MEKAGKHSGQVGVELRRGFVIIQIRLIGRAHHAGAEPLLSPRLVKDLLNLAADTLGNLDWRVSGPAQVSLRLLGNLHIGDGDVGDVFDHGIRDGAGQAFGQQAGASPDVRSPESVDRSSDGSPPYRAVSLEKLVGPCRQPAVAVRDALTGPVHLKCPLTSPSSRPVSGAYRVDSVVNSPVKWLVDPTDRVVSGPSALACYSAI